MCWGVIITSQWNVRNWICAPLYSVRFWFAQYVTHVRKLIAYTHNWWSRSIRFNIDHSFVHKVNGKTWKSDDINIDRWELQSSRPGKIRIFICTAKLPFIGNNLQILTGTGGRYIMLVDCWGRNIFERENSVTSANPWLLMGLFCQSNWLTLAKCA